jgi:hypothetical protein
LIRFETAHCFDVVEETGWDSVIVEGFVWVRGAAVKVYPSFVFGPGYCQIILFLIKWSQK